MAAGVLGYILIKLDFSMSPIVIGIILGPMAETNLRRTMAMSGGDYSVFFTRPICATFLIIAVFTLFVPMLGPKVWAWWKKRSGGPVLPESKSSE